MEQSLDLVKIDNSLKTIKEKSVSITNNCKDIINTSLEKSISLFKKVSNSKILMRLSQLPVLKKAIEHKTSLVAILPEEIKEGLKNGTLDFMRETKDGSLISTIINKETGKIYHQLRLDEMIQTVNPMALNTLAYQNFVTAQLESIGQSLTNFSISTNSKLNQILKELHDDRIVECQTAIEQYELYVEDSSLKRNLADIFRDLQNAENSLMREIESKIDYLSSIEELIKEKKDPDFIEQSLKDIKTSECNIFESMSFLQIIASYELDIAKKKDNKEVIKILKKYFDFFSIVFTQKNIFLLNGFSCNKEIPVNYWYETMNPYIQDINKQYLALENFTKKRVANEHM